ncbi:MAG: thioredoxin domain-containing protein [Labilithrix sp.]|nr:thioredoxin domain-containing protein [Labilithrix sp.]MCW5815121.1 thioredoxin domain-containing protein [Labilithrix sp.]
MNKLTPWILSLLTITQCAHSEAVEEPAPTKTAAAVAPSPTVALLKSDADPAVKVPIDGLPSFGDESAAVTVVMFTDYECPYCAKANARFTKLKEEYGADLRVVVASQPLPIHDHAAAAARAFLAAVEQGKGEAMHAKLFAMNDASQTMDDEGLRGAAREIGLDVAAFDRARTGPSTASALAKSEVLSSKLGVNGTPTFFVNGRRIVGARPIETFRALFDEERTKTRANGLDYAHLIAQLPEPLPPKVELVEDDSVYDVDVASAPTRGAFQGPITVVLFSDYECPYCVRAEKTLRELEAQRPGQIKIAYKFRPLPFHKNARLAAKASLAAERQGKFWPYHDVLLQHRDALGRDDLIKYATELGLSPGRFERDMDDPALEERIKADEEQADKLGAKGTPTAFMNGRRITGAQPLPRWLGLAERVKPSAN